MSKSRSPQGSRFLRPAVLIAAALGLGLSSASAQSVPRPRKIVYMMMENSTYARIIGDTNPRTGAPYINSLLPIAANMTQAVGLTHPTDPNYFYAINGTDMGLGSANGDPRKSGNQLTAPNYFRQLLDAGFTFANYAQNLPASIAQQQAFAPTNGPDGQYYLDENVCHYWIGTGTNQIPQSVSKDFADIPADFNNLPDVSFWHLTENNNMHQGFTTELYTNGDNWVRKMLANYVQWAMKNDSLLILTWDESNVSDENPALWNHIPTLFVGPMVRPGNYNQSINHNHMLRTMEAMHGLPFLNGATTATTITDIWKTSPTEAPLVSLEGPVNFRNFEAGATLNLSAVVTANGHAITKVQFYDGATLLAEDTAAPYAYAWTNVPAAPYGRSLSAKVVYGSGSVASSAPVCVGVWPASQPLGNGLVAYLNFDDNIAAQGGASVGGTAFPAGRIPRYAAGKFGKAASFLNTGGSAPADWAVSLGNLDSTYAGNFTYSFWVKTTMSGDYAIMGNKDWASGGNTGWVVTTNPSGKTYNWRCATGNRHDLGTNPRITDGAWHMVTQSFDRTNNVVTCYLDGKPYNTSTLSTNSGSLSLGAGFNTLIGSSGPGSYSSTCLVDDVAVWNRLLSPVEVAAIAANAANGQPLLQGGTPPPPPAITDNLLVYLKLDGNMTAQAGTAVNGAAFNGTPHYAPGKFGQAASFLNNGSSTAAPSDWAITLGSLESAYAGDWSTSLWVKTASTADSAIMGNKDWDSGSAVGWVISTLSPKHVNWNTSGGARRDVGVTGFTNGTWRNLVVTCNRASNRMLVYLDGALVSTNDINATGTLSFNAGLATLIGSSGPGTYASTAEVDDVAVWSRTLTAAEIADINTRGQAGQPLVP